MRSRSPFGSAFVSPFASPFGGGGSEQPAFFGVIFNSSAISPPSGWVLAGTAASSWPYANPPGYGFEGSAISSTTHGLTGKTLSRLNGRLLQNVSPSQQVFRVTLGLSGSYMVYAGFTSNALNTVSIDIRDGAPGGPSRHSMSVAMPTVASVIGISGTVYSDEFQWDAASAYGGEFVTINITNSSGNVYITRFGSGLQLCCIAFVKV